MAFLRSSDVIRVRQKELLSEASLANPFSQQILQQMSDEPKKSWLGLGWRQFMYWFADIEARIDAGLQARTLLVQAEANWRALEDSDILMEEPRNDGSWIRAWRRAVAEYPTF